MGDWANPIRSHWIERLDRELRSTKQLVLLAAHSLGCLAVAWWAAERWSIAFQDIVAGALLVAPPDTERCDAADRIRTFSPAPRAPLPFATMLVANRDDPSAWFATSARMAEMWGSELVDAGDAGHINAASGLGYWPEGLRLLGSLAERAAHQFDSGVWTPTRQTRPSRARGLEISDPV
jgi:hypothetical protein